MQGRSRGIPVILLLSGLLLGGCADNEYGEDESASGVDETPNAVAEPGFAESPVEDAGIGEGEEEFGGPTGGVMGEDVGEDSARVR